MKDSVRPARSDPVGLVLELVWPQLVEILHNKYSCCRDYYMTNLLAF
jgi:hypothetical protein